jgi:hypothetical protein
MFRMIAVVAASALFVGCAADSTEDATGDATSEIRIVSAERVLGDAETAGKFVEGRANIRTLTFKNDQWLSEEMRHKFTYQEHTTCPGCETPAAVKGTVKITWHAAPSWQNPLAGAWHVDLHANNAAGSAPPVKSFEAKYERTKEGLRYLALLDGEDRKLVPESIAIPDPPVDNER